MISQRRGHIVNVSSVAGRISPPHMGLYAASKHALAALSDALRVELSSTGIGVSTLYPGLTATPFLDNMPHAFRAPAVPPRAPSSPSPSLTL